MSKLVSRLTIDYGVEHPVVLAGMAFVLELELKYLTTKHGKKLAHEVQKEDLVEVIVAEERDAERQNNIRKGCRPFFNWCVANGYTQSNPAELVPVKTVDRREIVTLAVAKKGSARKAKGKIVSLERGEGEDTEGCA